MQIYILNQSKLKNGCIKAAILIANDPDGYEGQAFCRWVADIMAKGKSIDWEKYC